MFESIHFLPPRMKPFGIGMSLCLCLLFASRTVAQHTPRTALDPVQYRSIVRVSGVAYEDANVHPTGSGVVVAYRGRRLVVTNYHVVRGCRWGRFTIQLSDGTKHATRLLIRNAEDDVALLDASKLPENVSPINLAAADVTPGANVWITGYGQTGVLASSFGRVSARLNASVIALAVTVAHGDSGGPVFSVVGEVVGLVFAKNAAEYADSRMVPVSRVHATLTQLDNTSTSTGWICGPGGCRPQVPEPREPAPQYAAPPIQVAPQITPQQLPQPPPVDLTPITDALGKQAIAAEKEAESTSKLADAIAGYVNAQKAEKTAQQAEGLIAPGIQAGRDAYQGWQQGGLRGAAQELTNEDSVGNTANLVTQLGLTAGAMLGVSPLYLLLIKFGMPLIGRWFGQFLNGRLKSMDHTEFDDVAAEIGRRTARETNDDYEKRTVA